MTLCFPDLNVWLALSDASHLHCTAAWHWLESLPRESRVIFSRYTQIGLLRLLSSASVMGDRTVHLGDAWRIYDRWLADARIDFHPEPRDLDPVFRRVTAPYAKLPASKAVGDCFLLAHALALDATLVTFDQGLLKLARQMGCAAVLPT